jgi:hypothetical protein
MSMLLGKRIDRTEDRQARSDEKEGMSKMTYQTLDLMTRGKLTIKERSDA